MSQITSPEEALHMKVSWRLSASRKVPQNETLGVETQTKRFTVRSFYSSSCSVRLDPSSCHEARSGVHPEKVIHPSKSHAETSGDKLQTLSDSDSLLSQTHQAHMFLDVYMITYVVVSASCPSIVT